MKDLFIFNLFVSISNIFRRQTDSTGCRLLMSHTALVMQILTAAHLLNNHKYTF